MHHSGLILSYVYLKSCSQLLTHRVIASSVLATEGPQDSLMGWPEELAGAFLSILLLHSLCVDDQCLVGISTASTLLHCSRA
jgi:hypothetical protein